MKPTPEEISESLADLETFIQVHRNVIESDLRTSRPFHELETALHVKYENATERAPA